MKKPNILFAIADDASHMGIGVNEFVKTPGFDKVAQRGVVFKNAFTTNPKCAPSRASILTGMHTWQLEEAGNHYGIFPSKFEVYPTILEDAGYLVGHTGKGWSPGDWKAGGFTRNPAGPVFNEKKLVPPENSGISNNDYTANFSDFLSNRKNDQPFCFWYGGHEPHRQYNEGEGIRAGKTIDSVNVPQYLPNDDVVKSDLLDYAFEIEWFDNHLSMMLNKLEEIGELDNTIVVVTSDNGMPFPRVKGQMYESDFHLPLAIAWPAEVKGGRRVEDLVSFIDLAPTFLEIAGHQLHSQMQGKSLLNILRSDLSGNVDSTRDRVYMGKERHDLGTEGDVSYPVRCIRSEQFLYVRNLKPELWPAGNPETGFTNVDSSPTKSLILEQQEAGNDYYYNLAFAKRPLEQLYDILEDPDCMNNLAEVSEYSVVKEQLWVELRLKLIETEDPRIIGDGNLFDSYKYVGNDSHSWKAYVEGRFIKQPF